MDAAPLTDAAEEEEVVDEDALVMAATLSGVVEDVGAGVIVEFSGPEFLEAKKGGGACATSGEAAEKKCARSAAALAGEFAAASNEMGRPREDVGAAVEEGCSKNDTADVFADEADEDSARLAAIAARLCISLAHSSK